MRNLKKFLALVLAMLMVVSAAATVSAFDDVTEEHDFYVAIQDLVGKEIVQGKDENTFDPDGNVTRLQAAIMFARALTGETDPTNAYWNKGLSQFSDVTEFQYAVTVAVNAGIINGMGDGTYNPTGDIQFIQALKMAVCALGYGEGLTWGADGMEYYNVAVDLGLTAGLDYITEASKALTRGEFAQLIYNMIYADLADGTGSIAYNVFKVGYVEPEPEPVVEELTTFIITATDEQTAAYGMDVAEGGFVGLQQLVNGIPAGDVVYVPVEVFGFEDDEDEDAFLSAYNFVNYDAKAGSWDRIEATGTVDVITHADVTVSTTNELVNKVGTSYKKVVVDGVNYYAVEELTGSAIRNEVVIFNSTNYSATASQKQLFLNAAGQVLSEDGEVILEAVYSVAGDIVSYRALREDPDANIKKGAYLSVAKATELYGATVGVSATPYSTMTAADLTGAYQLTIYDDDMDGKMDRAYFTPIYISVKEAYYDTDKHSTDGPFKGHDEGTYGKISGMEDLAKGDVFVYTYNEQLKHVDVLDVLEIQEGAVKKISTTTNKSSTWYSTITLTDGTALKLYNYDSAYATAEKALGGEIQVSDAITYTDANGWMYEIYNNLDFDLIDDDNLLSVLETGDLVRYYARNGVILFAETYDIEENYERIVMKEVVDADLEALYVDAYVDGVVEELTITKIYDVTEGEYITLENLSWLQISRLLSKLTDGIEAGSVYRIAELENGYQLSVALDDGNTDNTSKAIDAPAKFGLFAMALTAGDDVILEDNICVDTVYTIDPQTKETVVDYEFNRNNRLRTNEDTIWYFIDENGKVTVFSGEIDDAVIDVTTKTRIFADKIGYANVTGLKNKGTASVVYVYEAGADTTGFGWSSYDTSIVIMTAMTAPRKTDYYDQGSAEEVGLDPKNYKASNYYKYGSSYAIDMFTGAPATVYSTSLLDNNTAYVIDENGVVVGPADYSNFETAKLTFSDIDYDDEYITIDDIDLTFGYEVEKLYALKADATTANIKKTSSAVDDIITSTEAVVTYLDLSLLGKPVEDGIVVLFVGTIAGYTAPETPIDGNATYTYDTTEFDVKVSGITGGVLKDVKVQFADKNIKFTTADIKMDQILSMEVTKETADNKVDHSKYGFEATADANGVLSFSIVRNTYSGKEYMTLDAGYTYRVFIKFANADGAAIGDRTLVFMLEVPAAN